MRYVIKYTKENEIKFVSHLDLMRTLQRIIRRSGILVKYSSGFNPHMEMSIASPLPVGTYSRCEYLDIFIEEEISEDDVINRLNEYSNIPIKFIFCHRINNDNKKFKNIMAIVEASSYSIKITYDDTNKLEDEIKEMFEKEEWLISKKGKNGISTVNIKPMIIDFKYTVENNELNINCILKTGSTKNLSPQLLNKYLAQNTTSVAENKFVAVFRTELFTYDSEKLISIEDFIVMN